MLTTEILITNILVQKWKIVTWRYLKLLPVYSILLCSTGTADRKLPNSHNNIFKLWSGTGFHWPPVDLTTKICNLSLSSWAKMVNFDWKCIFSHFRSKINSLLIPKKRFKFFQKTRFCSSLCRGIYFNRQTYFTKNRRVIWFNSYCSSHRPWSSVLRK